MMSSTLPAWRDDPAVQAVLVRACDGAGLLHEPLAGPRSPPERVALSQRWRGFAARIDATGWHAYNKATNHSDY